MCASRRCLVFARGDFKDFFTGLASAGRVSPRQARHFSLLRQSKVPKRKATLRQRPLRCATGQPAVLGHGLRGRTRCRPMAFRSNSCRESVHEVLSLFGDQTQPMPCAPRRWQKGVEQPNLQQPAGIVLFEIVFGFLASGAHSARASSYQIHRDAVKHQRRAQRPPHKEAISVFGPPNPFCLRRGAQGVG